VVSSHASGSRQTTVPALADAIARNRHSVPERRSLLVAVIGIDGSGKGYVAGRLTPALEAHECDRPRDAATLILRNDLEAPLPAGSQILSSD
jgi:hypothetical protein